MTRLTCNLSHTTFSFPTLKDLENGEPDKNDVDPSSFFSFYLCPTRSHFYLSSPFSADFQELARQNKITKQILEAFIQKKLGVRKDIRPPSIHEILPVMRHQEDRVPRGSDEEQLQENQEFAEDDSLQSVESEQIASIYSEGMYYWVLL